MNIHTAKHDANVNEYAKASVQFFFDSVRGGDAPHDSVLFLDLGCNDGFTTDFAAQQPETSFALGVELYGSTNDEYVKDNTDYVRENLEDPLLVPKLFKNEQFVSTFSNTSAVMVFLNHVIEHLYNPYLLAASLEKLKDYAIRNGSSFYLFVAVPEANSPWATWEGHYSLWTHDFMEHFFGMFGLQPHSIPETRCFRGNNVELWRVFK